MSAGAHEPDPYWDQPDEEGAWHPYSEAEMTAAAQMLMGALMQDARILMHLSGAMALALLGRHEVLDTLAATHPPVGQFVRLATWQAQQIVPPADNERKPNN